MNPLGNNVDITADGDMGGARTFLFTDTNTQSITLGGAGKTWTDATTVKFTAGVSSANKTVTNSAGVDLTVQVVADDLDDGTNLVGSATSLNDTLEITASATNNGAADLDDVDYFDTIIIKDSTTAGADAALTLNENLTTAMQSKLTIDATELDGSTSADETLTVNVTTSQSHLILQVVAVLTQLTVVLVMTQSLVVLVKILLMVMVVLIIYRWCW